MSTSAMKAEPVHSEPALLVTGGKERILVIADAHLGMEYELLASGFRIPLQSAGIIRRLVAVCEKARPTRLVVLGDLKHNIPKAFFHEKAAIDSLIGSALELCDRIDIVPGNHDGMLGEMIQGFVESGRVTFHGARGFSVGDAGFFHGHTWPAEELVSKKILVMSHIHPAIKLSDTLGGGRVEKCWVRGSLDGKNVKKFYPKARPGKNQDVIVMPAFNELCGSPVGGRKLLGPMLRNGLFSLNDSRIYLLDGTALGVLRDLLQLSAARVAKS